MLGYQWGALFSAVLFSGCVHAGQCQGHMTQEELLAETLALIKPKLPDPATTIMLEPISSLEPFTAYVSVGLLTSIWRSRVGFQVVGCDATGQQKTTVLWFRPQIEVMGWVYGKSAKQNQPVSSTALLRQKIDLIKAHIHADELADFNVSEASWLTMSVQQGMPVLKKHLQEPSLVNQHETVNVISDDANIRIEVQGVALQCGQYLSRIPVQITRSKQILQAIVMGKGEVYVKN